MAEIREKAPSDTSLACPIDNKLLRDAVRTPCCETAYCEECIQSRLLERDFICPNCNKKIGSLDKLVPDKPLRLKVLEYIDKAMEDSKREEEASMAQSSGSGTAGAEVSFQLTFRIFVVFILLVIQEPLQSFNLEQDVYSDQQSTDLDFQMLVDRIPQLQAQISQITIMLQNPSLPHGRRQTTEQQQQQLKMELQQAQTLAAVMNTFQQQQQMQQAQANAVNAMMQQSWANNNYVTQQATGPDSAYQRLPVNNRRRNLKRERPSDFLEVGGEGDSKNARYWE
jgi:protein MPE1